MNKLLLVLTGCVLSLFNYGCISGQPVTPPQTDTGVVQRFTDSAHYFHKKGDLQQALVYHEKALMHSRISNLPEHQARSLASIGKILSSKGDTAESLAYMYRALTIARQIRHRQLQADIYAGIAAMYKQQENYKAALNALELHQQLTDTLLQQKKQQELAAVQAHAHWLLARRVRTTLLLALAAVALISLWYLRRTGLLNRKLLQHIQIRDKLFSILGHDLRGPANNLSEGLALIESGGLSAAEEAGMVHMLTRQSAVLSSTLDTLLQWAKTQWHGIKAKAVHFDAADAVDKNILLHEALLKEKNIRVVKNIPPQMPLFADAHHFDLIIRNLLSNAIKYSGRNSTVEIGGKITDKELVFSVADEGVGMSAGDVRNFAAGTMDPRYGTAGEKGTGLGLILVKDFVEVNKGRTWLKSEVGKGTTFYFAFPQ